MTKTLVDAGPLYAFCARRDHHHPWAQSIASELTPPLLTCEPVLTEVFWRIQKHGGDIRVLWEWIQERVLVVEFCAAAHWPALRRLMLRYAEDMDFADACLVRMSELISDCRLWTIDRHFKFYRRHERLQIPLIFPEPGRLAARLIRRN